jgi:hypothetical protein
LRIQGVMPRSVRMSARAGWIGFYGCLSRIDLDRTSVLPRLCTGLLVVCVRRDSPKCAAARGEPHRPPGVGQGPLSAGVLGERTLCDAGTRKYRNSHPLSSTICWRTNILQIRDTVPPYSIWFCNRLKARSRTTPCLTHVLDHLPRALRIGNKETSDRYATLR